MKRILMLILVFVMTASFSCVSYAMEIEEETAVGNVVDSDLRYGDIFVTLFTGEWSHVDYIQYTVGDYLNLSYPANERFVYLFNLEILSYLTEEQKYLITNSLNTTLIAEVSIEYSSDPGYSSTSFLPRFTSIINGGSEYQINFSETQAQPVKGTYEVNYGNYFYGNDINLLSFLGYSYFNGYGDKLIDMQYLIKSLKLTIRTEGVDKSTADIVVNLGNINNSINQGFDNLGNQIGDVQEDINSGFNEVGGKLDSMLTPDSNNQQAVDQMGGQVNNNKQEAEDIKNQIDSLDKPDPDDLIEQIDPDQFIDNDDEAVQEMTGILASVTGSKVIKNYLLLLICVGIVSFVVYGKKGG